MAGARHGMCELTHGMAGEQHGNGMGTAWARHVMCESALKTLCSQKPAIYPAFGHATTLAGHENFSPKILNDFVVKESRITRFCGTAVRRDRDMLNE
jgi:hypothetical protein